MTNLLGVLARVVCGRSELDEKSMVVLWSSAPCSSLQAMLQAQGAACSVRVL